MWNSKRREAERERDEAQQRAEQAEAARAAAEADRAAAQAERDKLKKKYEPPVTKRTVIPSGFESNRRKH
jgi:hypothetical protein